LHGTLSQMVEAIAQRWMIAKQGKGIRKGIIVPRYAATAQRRCKDQLVTDIEWR
jgi:hypothetical protein